MTCSICVLCVCIYIYIYICMCIYIYIYIYMFDRAGMRKPWLSDPQTHKSFARAPRLTVRQVVLDKRFPPAWADLHRTSRLDLARIPLDGDNSSWRAIQHRRLASSFSSGSLPEIFQKPHLFDTIHLRVNKRTILRTCITWTHYITSDTHTILENIPAIYS